MCELEPMCLKTGIGSGNPEFKFSFCHEGHLGLVTVSQSNFSHKVVVVVVYLLYTCLYVMDWSASPVVSA